MTIDLKELESSLISARTLLALEKVWKEKGELIAYIKDWTKVIAELRAAREVVEAARVGHIVHLDFATYGLRPPTDGAALYLRCECCVCEGILKAIKQYDETRRG